MDSETIIFSAPAKVILFGEHAVVYGHPAIVMAINLRAKCFASKSQRETFTMDPPEIYPDDLYIFNEKEEDFVLEKNTTYPVINPALYFIAKTISEKTSIEKYPHISISSDIPSLAGLGSSAAVAVATIASLSTYMGLDIELEEINEIAFEAEKYIHGKPSGIDNTIATYGGIQYYKKRDYSSIDITDPSPHLLIVNSLILRSTKQYVEKVAELTRSNPIKYNSILQKIGALAEDAKSDLIDGNLIELGRLMEKNHQLLEDLGVGNPILNDIRNFLKKRGSLGSKLTGAGGGGCVIALFDDLNKAKKTSSAIEKLGYQVFISNLSEKGVKRE
ncbi:MAG: mevalonate kinase [Candidatus Heimdallarchaeota archaeon]|nr:mevalonate kinase [Candidatus Heimdallarchaeota archaeon]MCK4954248.1 mevalonate kinase [Candidatus Heimdallarchaeota archaeon]